jgi:hypothetical protein
MQKNVYWMAFKMQSTSGPPKFKLLQERMAVVVMDSHVGTADRLATSGQIAPTTAQEDLVQEAVVTPPAVGSPTTKLVNGISQTWCQKCHSWTKGPKEHS